MLNPLPPAPNLFVVGAGVEKPFPNVPEAPAPNLLLLKELPDSKLDVSETPLFTDPDPAPKEAPAWNPFPFAPAWNPFPFAPAWNPFPEDPKVEDEDSKELVPVV